MNIKYRSEIDGLRTIAVLSVIIYHAEFKLKSFDFLKGGFFGVDIFFVISGFLITSLIINEYNKTNKFSILNFYERRARRLLPALFAVILISLPAAWIILFPKQFTDYLGSIIASLFFSSNFYWHLELQEYGTESSLLRPFLHTWSLAVEEQFYILYPVLFIFISRWSKQNILFLLFAIFLISLIFAEYMTSKKLSFSFYLLPSRIWELLSGGMLAVLLSNQPNKLYNSFLSTTMPILGLIMILYSLLFIDFESHHPGFITLLPVIGTILIIWFSNTSNIVTKVLKNKYFVGIGLISYSLYLWHYPIFAFGRLIEPAPNEINKLVWICLTFIFSIITYYSIEIPFRRKDVISLRPLASMFIITSIFILSFSTYGILNNGLKERHKDLIHLYGKNEFDNKSLREESWSILNNISKTQGFDRSYAGYPSEFEKSELWFSTNLNKTNVLIVGDSHGKDIFNSLYQNADKFPNHEFARFGMGAKIPNNQISELITSPNFKASDVILISFKYTKYTIKELTKLLNEIKEQEKIVLITSNTAEFILKDKLPIFDWYLQNKSTQHIIPDRLNKLLYENLNPKTSNINKAISNIAKQNSIIFLDKYGLVCDNNKSQCTGLTPNGYKPFYDYGHWTLEGAKYFGQNIIASEWF